MRVLQKEDIKRRYFGGDEKGTVGVKKCVDVEVLAEILCDLRTIAYTQTDSSGEGKLYWQQVDKALGVLI